MTLSHYGHRKYLWRVYNNITGKQLWLLKSDSYATIIGKKTKYCIEKEIKKYVKKILSKATYSDSG